MDATIANVPSVVLPSRVTTESSGRLLSCATSTGSTTSSDLLASTPNKPVGFLESLFNGFLKLFGYDRAEENQALEDNFIITAAIAIPKQAQTIVAYSDQPAPLIFDIHNEYGEEETHQLSQYTDGHSTSWVAHEQIVSDNDHTVIRRFGIEKGTIQNVIKELKGKKLEDAIKNVIARASDLETHRSKHRIECLRFAFSYVEQSVKANSQKFQDVGPELAAYITFFRLHPDATYEQFKLEVARHHIENPQISEYKKDIAARYLLNNATHINDRPSLLVGASYVVNHPKNFSSAIQIQSIKAILKSSPERSAMSSKEAIQHVLHDASVNKQPSHDPASLTLVKSAITYIRQNPDDNLDTTKIWKEIINNLNQFHPAFGIAAAQSIIKFPCAYTKDEITLAKALLKKIPQDASTFILDKRNKPFFELPSKDQAKFLSCFTTESEKYYLYAYSKGLTEVLRANDAMLDIGPKQSLTGDHQKLSMMTAWLDGHFSTVINTDYDVALFILLNKEHRAINAFHSNYKSDDLSSDEFDDRKFTDINQKSTTRVTPPNTQPVLSRHVTAPSLDLV